MVKEHELPDKRRHPLKVRAGPAGLHFYDRITGVNILFDEITIPTFAWAAGPRYVSIALTDSCDLACPHCFAPKGSSRLDFGHLKGWLAELDANGCIGVGFGGGEPTLYPKLSELCSFAATKTDLAVVMTTHAHSLNDQLLDKLAGNLHFIRVSMDGIGCTYESIRCRPFNILLERITALRRITNFGVNYVVNSKTIGDLDAAAQLAADYGASEFLLIPEVAVGQGEGIDSETVSRMRDWVTTYHASVPLAISESGAEGLPVCNPFKYETGLAAFAHIDASGVIKRTSYEATGVGIEEDEIMGSLAKLRSISREDV